MRRVGVWSLLLLAHVLAWGGAVPQALVLADTTLVPVRTVAPWLGASVTLITKPGGVTLTRNASTVTVTWNSTRATASGKAIMLPAPACVVKDTAYLPARALVGVFAVGLAWDAKTATLTLTQAGKAPLSLQAVPFPRPACVQDDTLAGLTPGDHLALAVALWGNPTEVSEGNLVPGATDYTFRVDPQGGIWLIVIANGNEILLISSSLSGKVPRKKLAQRWLQKTGSLHGMRLAIDDYPQYYGEGRDDYAHDTGDVILTNYFCGPLTIIGVVSLDGDEPTISQIMLARRGVNAYRIPVQMLQ
ncbi:MAG TPA: copper amine oxidase N-terminal domain-containing protein [Armatimonadota bacterium]|nr:copper amine oxidase N-terminal domain-containing protein [Armatimonadota bacterium]